MIIKQDHAEDMENLLHKRKKQHGFPLEPPNEIEPRFRR